MPKVRVSGKIINFNFPKVSKITKIGCLELSTATSSYLDFYSFRKRERERKREKERESERERQRETERETERQRETERVNSSQGSLLILDLSYPNCCTLNGLA